MERLIPLLKDYWQELGWMIYPRVLPGIKDLHELLEQHGTEKFLEACDGCGILENFEEIRESCRDEDPDTFYGRCLENLSYNVVEIKEWIQKDKKEIEEKEEPKEDIIVEIIRRVPEHK